MPTAQFLFGKTSSGKFAIPPQDTMVKYSSPLPRVRVKVRCFSEILAIS